MNAATNTTPPVCHDENGCTWKPTHVGDSCPVCGKQWFAPERGFTLRQVAKAVSDTLHGKAKR